MRFLFISVILFFMGCADRAPKYDNVKLLESNDEYDKKLMIREIGEPAPLPSDTPQPKLRVVKAKPFKKRAKKGKLIVPEAPKGREPSIEETEGFAGRRPIKDPFRVGEEVDLAITYLRMTAGHLKIKVMPFVEVNGKKAYHFQITAKSNDFFSRFYSVDDVADTYVDYETLLPQNLEVHVKESKQLKEIRSIIDHEKLTADYWEKKVSKDNGEEKKKMDWAVLPFSQNIISAAYYMRNFTLIPGKTIHFRLVDEGKNIVFNGHVLRQEILSTDVGVIKTVVIKPDFQIDGFFKPVGEILFYVTDDDRKMIVRIESVIKIGTLVAKVVGIDKGKDVP